MEKNTNKTADARMEDGAGNLAVTLLAYNDMGAETELNHSLVQADRNTLGKALALLYAMAVQERGKTATEKAARIVCNQLQTSLDSLDKTLPHAEYQAKGLPLSFGRGLLLHLSTGETERYAELWDAINARNDMSAVYAASILLGFASSVINPSVVTADCE